MGAMNFLRVQWDRTGAVVAVVAGVVVLIIGWIGTSTTEYVAAQVPYVISAGVGGIFLLGIGAALWISADLRDEWREMRTLSVQIRREQEARGLFDQN